MTIKNVLKTVIDRVAGAKSAATELRDHEQALRREHAALEADRARLLQATPPKADLLATLDREIQALGAQWAAEYGSGIISALAGAVEVSPGGEVTGLRAGALGAALDRPVGFPMLCAIAPALVRESLAAIVHAAVYEAGPSMTDRPRLITEMAAAIARVEAQHTELVDGAAEVGIVLELMPGPRAQRIQAEQRRALAARHNAANRDAIRRGAVAAMAEE